MTQPDKWNDVAFYLFAGRSVMVDELGMIDAAATALRSAYAEGERAGMLAGLMKAGAIATLEPHPNPQNDWYRGYEAGRNEAARDIYSEATAIRVAKETKNPPSLS